MLDRIEDAIADIRQGRLIVVVDDEDRENEGDLVMAACHASQETINFMAAWGRGLICVPITVERAEQLALVPMADRNTCPKGTAFTVSVDAREGTTTGISAAERALSARLLASPQAVPDDFIRPGHIFPLVARPGGVLERRGQTEASVDLARLAGLDPSGVICEIMNEDGSMARLPDLRIYCATHKLRLVSVEDLAQYRLKHGV